MTINQLKEYKSLFENLITGNTEELSRSEYKGKIKEMLADNLNKSYLNEYFYISDIEIDYHNTGYIAKIKANEHVIYYVGNQVSIDGFHIHLL